jgi:hypothetical protein
MLVSHGANVTANGDMLFRSDILFIGAATAGFEVVVEIDFFNGGTGQFAGVTGMGLNVAQVNLMTGTFNAQASGTIK